MSETPIARTVAGEVEGEWNEGVARFRGIPFADRIDGTGRFHPPRPTPSWTGVRKARTWAPLTPQIPDVSVVKDAAYHRFLFGKFYDTPMSEDGLFLNVWTPAPERGAKRPVMVWLHGGGFATGTPTRAREEPSLISARGDLVVVAPNHRLGAFGYLYLEQGGRPLIAPNIGMLDIVAALQWVQENIEAFGGDPRNVTVFGESGGAMKTATLLSLPKAKGLFHRGICQAGVFAPGFRFRALSREQARDTSERILARLGVDRSLETLAALPMQVLIDAQENTDGGLMAWRPVIDGETLPVDPAEALLSGVDAPVPMIVGSAAHEADFIFHGASLTVRELATMFGADARQMFDRYAAERPDDSEESLVEAILTDWTFGMPSISFAEARAKSGHPTYVYQMRWGRSDNPRARATHGAENPFVFDRLETTDYSRDAPDARPVATVMQGAWIAFARTGKPGPHWPAYGAPERSVMVFDRESRVVSDPKRVEREIWSIR